jgi:CheY-like chemotaxis protein
LPVPHGQKASWKPVPLRVLIVEDHVDSAVSLALMLRLLDYEVVIASDGQTALEKAQGVSQDVVLLDIGLPGMNGYEVAQRLKVQATGKPPFIIAVTGYGRPADRRRAAEVGIDLFFVKPADLDALLAVLKRLQRIVK